MQSPPARSHERPYRSHLRPACEQCRRRKSRCTVEAHSPICLMCRMHGTNCSFPNANNTSCSTSSSSSSSTRHSSTRLSARRGRTTPAKSPAAGISGSGPAAASLPILRRDSAARPETATTSSALDGRTWDGGDNSSVVDGQPTPLSADDSTQENPHIVGPAVTNDSQILADYLSTITQSNGGLRMVRPKPASQSKPVLFTAVQRRPLGLESARDPSAIKLGIIEKLIEPWAEVLVDIYFEKINVCMPLIDEQSFRAQYQMSRDRISPALLASLYAQALIFWRYTPQTNQHRSPDGRFIWNLANETLYSELHLNPGISTITAILLNIGGRPTTSLVGNGVLLGAAISLAHSLGLNRNPLSWDIPDSEKLSRMKIWWSLLIHDKWSSLAYGTPSHIRENQHDVPLPTMRLLETHIQTPRAQKAALVFVAFSGLTRVLGHYLDTLYDVSRTREANIADLEYRLNHWIEGLESSSSGDAAGPRQIITRGTNLHLPGAANLRFAYLSIQLLLRRLALDDGGGYGGEEGGGGGLMADDDSPVLANRYMQVRRTAEDVVLLAQELRAEQLGDFWLPVTAFLFPSATTFLLRCALETVDSVVGLAQSSSLRLAWDLLSALRGHRDRAGWDLGDICLAQHAEVVQRLINTPPNVDPAGHSSLPSVLEYQDMAAIPDVSFIDDLLPSLWDTFRDV